MTDQTNTPPAPPTPIEDDEPFEDAVRLDNGDEPATFVPVRLASLFDWAFAAVAFIVFFALYWTTSALWAHPGPSANLTARIIGAVPPSVPVEQFATWFFRQAVALVPGPSAARVCAVVSIAIAALDIALAYLLSLGLFRLLTDLTHVRETLERGPFHAETIPRLGAVVAMLALALSAPFWTASSRVNSQALHLLLLMSVSYLVLRYLATDRLRPLYVASGAYGLLCTQSPTAIQFMPLLAAGVLIGALRSERRWRVTFGGPVLLAITAFTIGFFACIYAFSTGPGYAVMGYSNRYYVVFNFALRLIEGSIGSLTSAKWLILGGLIVLPFFAWIAIGRISLTVSEKSRPLHFLNLAIFATALTVLLGSRYSPWSMFGFQPEQVTLYTMASMTLGYCVLAFHAQLLFFFERKGSNLSGTARNCGRAMRIFGIFVAVLVLAAEARTSRNEADAHATAYLRTYVDGVLDSLDGRDMLVTDALFADLFRVRANERGMPLSVIDLMEPERAPARRLFAERFRERPELRNALGIGILSFLQEFIRNEPRADRHLALSYLPDLWNLGPYRAKTLGLLFVGMHEDRRTVRTAAEASFDRREFLAFLDQIAAELDEVPADAPPHSLALSASVRRRISFIGNDLGYVLETEGHPADALELYRAVHRFDPENLSAMLNLYTSLDRAIRAAPDSADAARLESERDAVRGELETFRRELKKPLEIWELSRSQGYVYAPEAFAALGWSWAMTGQTPLALGTLGSALRDMGEGSNRSPLFLALAAVHGRRGESALSEEFYKRALDSNPNDVAALSGLASARLAQGTTEGVEEILDRLVDAGVPAERLLQTRVQLLLAQNRYSDARDIALAAAKQTKNEPETVFALFTADMALYSHSDPEDRPFYRTSLEESVRRLREDPESINYLGAIASGALHSLDRDWGAARDDFLRAVLSSPGDARLSEQVLRMDYALLDTVAARRHAASLLRINPDNGFANYVLGSLALQGNDVPSAIAYLKRSSQNWDSPLPVGDLAYAWQRAGEPKRAEELARQALEANPALYNVHDTLGLALLDQDRAQEAADCFMEAIRLYADDPAFHIHLARARLTLGEADAARQTLESMRGLENNLAAEEREFYQELLSDLSLRSR